MFQTVVYDDSDAEEEREYLDGSYADSFAVPAPKAPAPVPAKAVKRTQEQAAQDTQQSIQAAILRGSPLLSDNASPAVVDPRGSNPKGSRLSLPKVTPTASTASAGPPAPSVHSKQQADADDAGDWL